MSRHKILFILIIILSISLRFYKIGKIPNGLYSDEAAYGYNAYSILKTGKDEYGNFFPLAFKSFGDYKAPLYIYFLVPSIFIFGLSEEGVRLPSAILGTFEVFLVYILGKKLFYRKSFGLLSAFLVSVFPMGLQFNRMAHENNLSLILITASMLFFVLSLKYENYILITLAAFALSIYTYHDARILAPLLIFVLIMIYRKYLWQIRKKAIIGFFIFLLLITPLTQLIRTEAVLSRPKFTNIFSDVGVKLETNVERGEDKVSLFFAPFLFHNKITAFTGKFIDNYAKHFSFDFLFLTGESIKIYQTLQNGLFYISICPFLVLGIYFMFRRNLDHKWLMFLWFALSPIPAAFTRFVPSASRSLSLLPTASLITAFGIIKIIEYINYSRVKRVYLLFISLILSFNIMYYLHYYYFNTPIRYAKEWHYGMKDVISKVKLLQDDYEAVWFSKNAWGYIYPLFYLRYPPDQYQKEAKLSSLNEYGFGWVEGFDKYVFNDFPQDFGGRKDTLFIGAPSDFSNAILPLSVTYYPNGEPAFYIVDSNSL